jgi:4-amino-4-deoxy-L-arabinose transferase-like glycosyltransferase
MQQLKRLYLYLKNLDLYKSNIGLFLFLLLHLIVWTLIPTLTREALDSKIDMSENYVWGKEFQLGYYKHPPFFAWIVGIWFRIFPTTNFYYFLLSQVNIIVGFIFVYLLSKEIIGKQKALIAVMLLEFIPYYNILGIKLNANSILLSVWPAVIFFFYKAIKEDRWFFWVLTGISAAIALLSKYYSAMLFVAMIAFLLIRDNFNVAKTLKRKGIFFALGAFLLTMLPHFKWLWDTDFVIFKYVAEQRGERFILSSIKFLSRPFLYLLPVVLISKFALSLKLRKLLSLKFNNLNHLFLYSITFIPYIATFFVGLILTIETSGIWGMPIWFLFTTILMSNKISHNDRIAKAVLGFLLLSLIVGISIRVSNLRINENYHFPGKKIAVALTEAWHAKYSSNLSYIIGENRACYYTSFYSMDHPSVIISFDYLVSPWVSKKDFTRKGGVIVCDYGNSGCALEARRSFKKYKLQWNKLEVDNYIFNYALIPPYK